jgi:exopolyphosphatase / guanosine-5'-triphosphate,3'-diphosphate pyrophosphatase
MAFFPPLVVNVTGPLAAIDIGSNSFRLELGEIHQGRYRRIDYLKETVRLGAGLDSQGLLSEEAIQRGLTCLSKFAKRLQGFEAARVRAVATQTLREAKNRNAFLLRAQQVLGLPIEVISGREEARLIFSGVARLQPSNLPRLVVDIGGRSTELIVGNRRQPQQAESFQVGSVSLSMKYFTDGQLTAQAFRAAQIAAGAELEEALEPFSPAHWEEALGSSGTVGAVSQVLIANNITDGRITPDSLRWLIEQCLRAKTVDQLNLAGLKEDRKAVVPGGLCILYTLAIHFGISELLPAKGALRQGVIFDLEERLAVAQHPLHRHDMRDASVRELQRRFGVNLSQAERVRQIAVSLFKQVCPQGDLEAQRELQWVAALHEIGMMVSHHDHHRHSAYLLSHADAPGFSQSQQQYLGNLLLAQRGGLRKVEAHLIQNEIFAWQTLCLRLALIKCHARQAVDSQALQFDRKGNQATLSFTHEWEKARPRTAYLMEEELNAWQKVESIQLTLSKT